MGNKEMSENDARPAMYILSLVQAVTLQDVESWNSAERKNV